VAIAEANTRPYRRRANRPPAPRRLTRAHTNAVARDDAARRFASAVDLYNSRRYAEALTLLNRLQQDYPGNGHVEAAREQCAAALEGGVKGTYHGRPLDESHLNPDLVKQVVLDKMLRGQSEAVQLQAADMAARMLGLYEAVRDEAGPSSLVVRPERGGKGAETAPGNGRDDTA